MAPLDRSFFQRATPEVARELLGQRIAVRGPQDERLLARVVETEAYLGPSDPGSHATRGRHTQAGALWGTPGTAYVYICYGIHQMLNVVAHPEGEVGAVLFRAAEPVEGVEAMRERRGRDAPRETLASGPGNLAEALDIRREEHHGVDLTQPGDVHLVEGERVPDGHIAVTGRVGLSSGSKRLLRFLDTRSPAVSRPVAPIAGAGGDRSARQPGCRDKS